MLSVEPAPGVELAKLTVVVTEPPGAMLPRLCGITAPLVAPSFAEVNMTLFAVIDPIFWIVIEAATLEALVRLRDDRASNLTCPHGVVQVRSCRVICSCTQPIVPVSPANPSVTLSFQTPFDAFPFIADSGESGLKLPANGATPAPIAVAAESSKTVGVPEQSLFPVP